MKHEIETAGQNEPANYLMTRGDTMCKVIRLIIKELECTDKYPITIFGEVTEDIRSVLISEPGGYNVPKYPRGRNESFDVYELIQVLQDQLNKLMKQPIENYFQLNEVYERIEDMIRDLYGKQSNKP